ncbi:MAG: Smr/MutS family protein [Candidatus Atribacteria bacterium]|nr:Smr/MutS family protein [Candidatus Atribacteria bacterium]
MEQQKEEMETLRQELEREKKGAGERFQKEGEHYWKKTREEIAQLIGQLRKEQSLNEDVYEHIKKRMKEKEEETDRLVHENNGSQTLEPPVILQGGEQVFVDFLNQNALVVEVDVNKKEAVISVKGRKIKTSVHHLKKLSPPPVVGDSGPFHRTDIRYSYQPTSSPVPNEIEIRMMKYEEAQEKLDKYLDQVLLAGYKTVYIIHGKGEGILRKMTQDSLRNNPAVESYRTGLPEEGGMGITVVTMR